MRREEEGVCIINIQNIEEIKVLKKVKPQDYKNYLIQNLMFNDQLQQLLLLHSLAVWQNSSLLMVMLPRSVCRVVGGLHAGGKELAHVFSEDWLWCNSEIAVWAGAPCKLLPVLTSMELSHPPCYKLPAVTSGTMWGQASNTKRWNTVFLELVI